MNLWRGLHTKKGGGLFDLIEEVVVYSAGRIRPPDIDIVNRGGSKWVTVAKSPRGISTFDKAGVVLRFRMVRYSLAADPDCVPTHPPHRPQPR